MEKQPRGRPASGGWRWGRTAHTQRALLDAAREVFTSRGFSEASIAEVVERAGSSVGSLYHHFGGKSELFLALWQEHQLAHEQAASEAVAAARKAGVTDPGELFTAGARAFLQGSWQRRMGQPERRPPAPAGHRAGPALRVRPHLADRRGRPRGGDIGQPPPGRQDH